MTTPINRDITVAPVRKGADDSAVNRRDPEFQRAEHGEATTQDTVTLTEPAQQLRAVQLAAFDAPEVDTQKVEAVRGTVEDGSYRVNAQRIAEKLLDLEQQLSGR